MTLRIRRGLAAVAVIVAVGLLGDMVRVLVAPSPISHTNRFEDITVTLTLDRQFVWRYGDCVLAAWSVNGSDDVYLNGDAVPATGEQSVCLPTDAPPPPADREDHPILWNTGQPEQVYRGFTQYPDVLIMARAVPNIDTFLHVSIPVYVLSADVLWWWRAVVAVGSLLLAGWLLRLSGLLATFARARNYIQRRPGQVTLLSVGIVVAVMGMVRVGVPLWLLSVIIQRTLTDGSLPLTVDVLSGLRAAGVLLVYVTASVTIGALLLRFSLKIPDDLAYLGLSFVAGSTVLALVSLPLATFGHLNAGIIASVWLLALVIGAGQVPNVIRRTGRLAVSVRQGLSAEPITWRVLVWLSGGLLLFMGLRVFGEMNWDGLTAYMAQTRLIAATGDVTALVPWWSVQFAHTGVLWEGPLVAAYTWGGGFAAEAQGWVLLVVVVGLVLALGRAVSLSRRGQIVLLVLTVSSSLFYRMVGLGKVDIYGLVMVLGALLLARVLADAPTTATAFWMGLLAGAGVAAKLTYLPTLAVFLALYTARTNRPRTLPHLWTVAALGALLPLALYALRNGVALGEPLAPFIYFGETESLVTRVSSADFNRERVLRTAQLLYPFMWAFPISESTLGVLSSIWPLVLPLAVWRLFSPTTDRHLRLMGWCALTAIAVWLVTVTNVLPLRYLAALLAVWLVLGAAGFAAVLAMTPNRTTHHLLTFSLYFALGAAFIPEATLLSSHAVVPSLDYRCELAHTDLCDGINLLNADAPTEARVFSNIPYTYPLRDDLLRCRSTRAEHLALRDQPLNSTWEGLYERGFTYVLDWRLSWVWHQVGRQHASALLPVRSLDPATAPDWLTVTNLYDEGDLRLYRLDASAGAPLVTPRCPA